MRTSRLLLVLLPALLSTMPGVPRSAAFAESNTKLIAPTPDGPAPFDPAVVRLDPSSAEQRMRDALATNDTALALQIGQAELPSATPEVRGRVQWLLARAYGTDEAGDAPLVALKDSDHPLSRMAALRLAERWVTRKPAEALALAKALDSGWSGAARARVLVALAQLRSGNPEAAEPLLRALFEDAKKSWHGASLAMPLAELLAARKDRASQREALALCRHVAARAIGTDAATQAERLATQILAKLPAKDRNALALPSAEDELARGKALMKSNKFPEAQAVLEKLAKREKRDAELRCQAELEAGHALFMQRQKQNREQAAKRLHALAGRCKDADVRAWALYYAGSARQRAGDPQGAVNEYERLARELPNHSLADDALYLQAFARADAGDKPGLRTTLERMLDHYPRGDMRSEARFALAMEARSRGDHTEALAQLDRLQADGPEENAEGMEGRTAYWRARTLQALGRNDAAKAAYIELARSLPLSYHAQQSLARLRELDAAAADALLTDLQREAEQPELLFPWRVELETPSFRSALELLRVGETELAQRELSWLGTLSPGVDTELLWLTASLLHEAHAYAEASQLVRSRLRSFRKDAPCGRARLLWRIAYPRAYEPLIEQVANEQQVPPELVRAVAREESSFNPDAVSTALAYGLIQLIRPTARMHADVLGLPSDPAALKRPEINLRIGSHLIRELWQRYVSNPAVIPAAYNAGYAATDRWLRESPGQPLDEWIERIPYRETRRYTRRVLQTYGIYAWLDTGKLPPLPATLPAASSSP
jgi:soluble lytic murein transglycosylase